LSERGRRDSGGADFAGEAAVEGLGCLADVGCDAIGCALLFACFLPLGYWLF